MLIVAILMMMTMVNVVRMKFWPKKTREAYHIIQPKLQP